MGDILEHWEQRVVVVVPGDLCHNHQHSDLLHLQVLNVSHKKDYKLDYQSLKWQKKTLIVSHQRLVKERKKHLFGVRQLPEGQIAQSDAESVH